MRLPDDDIERLERLAERRGTSKSALMREFARRELRRETVTVLRDIVGVLSNEEAEEMERAVSEVREEMDEEMRRRSKEFFER